MSKAGPIERHRRLVSYSIQNTGEDRWANWTPRQRRRIIHKRNRAAGKAGQPWLANSFKGRPTPRQRKPRRHG
jgi:hypothetical protein